MLLFQSAVRQAETEQKASGFEQANGITLTIARQIVANFQNPDAKISVIDNNGKEQMWTKKETGQQIRAFLKELEGSNPIDFLRRNMGAKDDAELFTMLKSKILWLDEKSFDELKAGGNESFKKIFSQLCHNRDFVKGMLRASIVTSNVGNTGENLNSIGLQETATNTATTFLIMALALSTADRAATGQEISIKAAGKTENLIGFEIDPKNTDHVCSYVQTVFLAAACIILDRDAAVYLGDSPEAANAKVAQNGVKNAENNAILLFGKDYVDSVKSVISHSVKKAFSTKGVRRGKIFSSFVLSRLEMQSTLNDMKENSEFAYNAAKEEQRKKDDRDGFMRLA